MDSKSFKQFTLQEIISKIKILIDIEIAESYKLKNYEDVTLKELDKLDTYMSILKLLNDLTKNKNNECI